MSDERSPARAAHERGQVVDEVLDLLAIEWPRVFSSEAREKQRKVWNLALADVPADVLVPAATRYLAKVGGKYAPDAPTFADYARELVRRHAEAVTDRREFTPRRFWFEKPGYDEHGKPAIVVAHAVEVPGGGYSGIAEPEMDALYAGERSWGWE